MSMVIHPNGTVLHSINANVLLERANQQAEAASKFLDKINFANPSSDDFSTSQINPIDSIYLEFLKEPLKNNSF
jgi:hypothetical protein